MKISIVTPSFNQGQFILRTVESVHQQIVDVPVEHMIFDAGSKDNTSSVLSQAATYMSHLKWKVEPDRGQAHAVNKGIQATTGEIIGWLNSDDVYYPHAFRAVLQVFQENPEVEVVYGMAEHIDLQDQPFETYPSEPWNANRLLQTCYICQPALFFRRSVTEKYGLLNESLQYCMDYEYWLRLSQQGAKFYYLKQKLAGSRLYPENKTLGDRVKVHAEIIHMLKGYTHKIPDRWLFNYAHCVVERKVDRIKQPYTYRFWLLLHSLKASLRWNGTPSLSYLKIILFHFTPRFLKPETHPAKEM